MKGADGEALDVALELMRTPGLRAALRTHALPAGVGEVLAPVTEVDHRVAVEARAGDAGAARRARVAHVLAVLPQTVHELLQEGVELAARERIQALFGEALPELEERLPVDVEVAQHRRVEHRRVLRLGQEERGDRRIEAQLEALQDHRVAHLRGVRIGARLAVTLCE